MNDCARKEFAVELYSKTDHSFVEQIDVYESEEEASQAILRFGKDENFEIELQNSYFGILCIEYDENENEINAYRINE